MAFQNSKSLSKTKCPQDKENRQKLFSFRWLLRRSRSSKSPKEMLQADKPTPLSVPSSKSCDAGLSVYEAVDRKPTFLLWKLLPPSGRAFGHSRSSNFRSAIHRSQIRTSFSCSDVYSMIPATSIQNLAESSQELALKGDEKSHTKQSWNRLHKCVTSSSCLDAIQESTSTARDEEFLPSLNHNVLCKLCLTMVPASKMYTLQDCSCVFCIACLKQYLTINIKEGNVTVTCPDADCGAAGKILVAEIREIAGENAFALFERYKLNRDVELDPNRVWCPAAGCETICTFKPPSNPDMGVSVYCLNCRTKFCSACKLRSHSNKTCEDIRKMLSEEIEFSSGDEDSTIKRCPNCRIPIEKDDGCAQMMCYRCKHVFCWHCLASLDDDFLLRHYDKGPCRNKLGHSRASMIWHRTQVVGIFAGFSFLLLMASPFLILAAPCLLCCRCKHKFFYEEATPL